MQLIFLIRGWIQGRVEMFDRIENWNYLWKVNIMSDLGVLKCVIGDAGFGLRGWRDRFKVV